MIDTEPRAAPRFPALTVATPRLDIRPLVGADAPDVEAILVDRLTRRWLPLPGDSTIDGRTWCTDLAGRQRDLGDGDHYGVLRREDGHLVGVLWTSRTDWTARSTEISYLVTPVARPARTRPAARRTGD